MSIASPDAIQQVGIANPAVLELARAVQKAGWRVTSIYRPTGVTHPKGIALDVAPLVYVRGGFGLHTARLLLEFAREHVPTQHWLAVAELDHIHLQLNSQDAIGINTTHGTQIYDPSTVSLDEIHRLLNSKSRT
jgi:hypothetical protein